MPIPEVWTWQKLAEEAEPIIDELEELYRRNPHIVIACHTGWAALDWLKAYNRTRETRLNAEGDDAK